MVEQRKAGKSKYQQGLMGRSHYSKSQPGGITLTLGGVVSGYEKMSIPQVTFLRWLAISPSLYSPGMDRNR